MVELFEQTVRTNDRQSSKGNQLKWYDHETWFKADYAGYEGLTECVCSCLMKKSTLLEKEYVLYAPEEIRYKGKVYRGCSSRNFLPEGWQLITLERLFKNVYGKSLYESLYRIQEPEQRLRFLVDQTQRITDLDDFGAYMSRLLTIDAFFLNEDRHTHNIGVLLDEDNRYHCCPVFDNGAGLLSDTTLDYPLDGDVETLIKTVEAKTFCRDFDEQLDIAEKLYGRHLTFAFDEKDMERAVESVNLYPEAMRKRVLQVLRWQRRKYAYLF